MMLLWKLLSSFIQIGAFSFGGGYAALPLIQHQVVELHNWLSFNEFSDLITISQMTPGPIAINSATFVGLKIDGLLGAIVATLGCIIPSCIIVSLIAYVYLKYKQMSVIQSILKYIRPAVVAMIGVSGLLIIQDSFFSKTNVNISSIVIFIVSIILLRVKKLNPIFVMIIAGIMQVMITYLIK